MGFFDSIKSGWNDFTSGVSSVVGKITDSVTPIISTGYNKVTNTFSDIKNTISSAASGVLDHVDTVYNFAGN